MKPKPVDHLAKGTNILDELDSISHIGDELETIQEAIESVDRGMGIIPAATRFDDKAQVTPEKVADKRPSMFYSRIGKGALRA